MYDKYTIYNILLHNCLLFFPVSGIKEQLTFSDTPKDITYSGIMTEVHLQMTMDWI